MIEESILPFDAGPFCEETFEAADNTVHAFQRGKRHQRMEVVRHGKKEVCPEFSGGHVMLEGSRHHGKEGRVGELILTAWEAANGDEENFTIRDPRRRDVEQPLT